MTLADFDQLVERTVQAVRAYAAARREAGVNWHRACPARAPRLEAAKLLFALVDDLAGKDR